MVQSKDAHYHNIKKCDLVAWYILYITLLYTLRLFCISFNAIVLLFISVTQPSMHLKGRFSPSWSILVLSYVSQFLLIQLLAGNLPYRLNINPCPVGVILHWQLYIYVCIIIIFYISLKYVGKFSSESKKIWTFSKMIRKYRKNMCLNWHQEDMG